MQHTRWYSFRRTPQHTSRRSFAARCAQLVITTLLTCATSNRASAQAVVAERRPTVAVMEFESAAMVKREEFAALTIGMQVMLANAIATNPRIEIVERQNIQKILAEQNLTTAGRVEEATAAKVGKLLGVRHMLLGAFVVLPNMDMRLTVRSVNTETGAWEWSDEVSGKGDQIFKLIDQLATKVNAGLKLPGIRVKAASKDLGTDGPNQLEAAKALSAARRLEEQGDFKGAIAMYQKSVQLNGDVGPARVRLAMLEKSAR